MQHLNKAKIDTDVDMIDGAIFTSLTIYEKVLEPLYPADYDGVGIKEKSIKIQDDTRKRINEGLGELIKAHGNKKT